MAASGTAAANASTGRLQMLRTHPQGQDRHRELGNAASLSPEPLIARRLVAMLSPAKQLGARQLFTATPGLLRWRNYSRPRHCLPSALSLSHAHCFTAGLFCAALARPIPALFLYPPRIPCPAVLPPSHPPICFHTPHCEGRMFGSDVNPLRLAAPSPSPHDHTATLPHCHCRPPRPRPARASAVRRPSCSAPWTTGRPSSSLSASLSPRSASPKRSSSRAYSATALHVYPC